MKGLVHHLKHLDWIIIGSSVLLAGMGLISMYSSSLGKGDFSNLTKQIIFFGIGICLMNVVSFFDYRLLRNDPYLLVFFYIIGIGALAGLFLPFVPEIRGVKGWYRIGDISIDPVEYVKLVLIILMAKYFSLRHIEMYRIRHILLSGIYFAVPVFLIFQKPDLGSASLLFLLWIMLLLVSGIKIRHFLFIIGSGILVFSLAWQFFLLDYQKNRIASFIEPELDPLGIGWSQLQAKIAIGNGEIWGKGIGKGTQTRYGFLSEPQTDFIFAAIAEEFGLIGITLLFVLFSILLWRILRIGFLAQSNFPRLVAIGFGILLIIQILINIGMNLGFLPIVGLSLPFVSYGGSSLLMNFLALGILQSIKRH